MSKCEVEVHRFARNVKGLGGVVVEERTLVWKKKESTSQVRKYLVDQEAVEYRQGRGVWTPGASRRPLDRHLTLADPCQYLAIVKSLHLDRSRWAYDNDEDYGDGEGGHWIL